MPPAAPAALHWVSLWLPATQRCGPILLPLKAMLELAIQPIGRGPPHAAEIEILLMSEAPLFISQEEKEEKIKERLLTAA